jgi:hypothetical protein
VETPGDSQELFASTDTDKNPVGTLDRKVDIQHSLMLEEDLEEYKAKSKLNYYYEKYWDNDKKEFYDTPTSEVPAVIRD